MAADSKTSARSLFRELHQHWTERSDAQNQLKLLPAQKKGRQAELEKKIAAVAEEREAIKRLKIETDKAELGLKSNDQRIRDLTAKLNQCRAPKEFEALQQEIAALRQNNSTLEEQILGMIADQEAKSAEIVEREKALDAAKQESAKFFELIDYKLQKMRDRISILDARIAEIEKQLDPDLAARYRRMTASKGAQGLAACDNGYCQNCNIEQSPQALAELGADQIVQCSSCAALLYRA